MLSAKQTQQLQRELRLVCLFIAASLALPVAAQERASSLEGRVVDENGALVVGAQVLLDDERGQKLRTETDKEGRYLFNGLPPGSYKLIASATGFSESMRPVEVKSSGIIRLDITLKVTLKEQLEVSTARDNLAVITITGAQTAVLPRDPRQLRRYLDRLGRANGASGSPTIYVDGFREAGRLPPKEVIESIRVRSDSFAAELAEPGEARVEITTKPATERFHGELSFSLNNASLNARDSFAPSRAPLQLRDYNAAFSGPLRHGRWGYFVDLSRTHERENAIVNATILSSVTLLPQRFSTAVLTPSRDSDISFRTNYLFSSKHQLDLRYSHSNSVQGNQGLEDGFDLPERGVNSSSREDLLRVSLTSIFGPRSLNEVRIELSRSASADIALSSGPAIEVLDSFNGGGNQDRLFSVDLSQRLQIADNVTYAWARHTLKAGIWTDAVRLRNTERENFGGTFVFGTDFERNNRGLPVPGPVLITPLESYRRTLLGVTGYRPLQFTINAGDPFIGLTQWETALFVQDDWRPSPRLTLAYGLREEFQTHLADKFNLAPRAALAARPFRNGEGTLRVGAGLFYSRLEPEITVDTARFNGVREEELVVQRPAFFLTIPPVLNRATSLTTLHTKPSNMNAPYSFRSMVSYEQPLPRKLSASLSYVWERGLHLLRTRNINAPLPGSPNVRPLPEVGPVLQYESSGSSKRHEFAVALKGDLNAKISFFGSYRLTFARGDTDSPTAAPANSYDLSTEFGRAAGDQRHQFYFETYVTLPWRILLGADIYAASGGPFNITTGSDDNGDTLFTDRPAFANAGDSGAIVTRFGIFNPHPQPGDRIIPRNFGRGSGELSTNLSLSKTFIFGALSKSPSARADMVKSGADNRGSFRRGLGDRQYSLTLSAEVSNLLNHTNFGEFVGIITSPAFGRPNSAASARRINLGIKFGF